MNKKDKSINKEPLLTKRALLLIAIGISLSLVLLALNFCLSTYALRSSADKAADKIAGQKSASADEIDLANALREDTVAYVFDKESIPAYSYDEVCNMDMSKPSGVTIADLKLVTKQGLVGLEDKLYQMEQDYDLNCLFLLGIASHESAYGTSLFHPNNICGYGYAGYSSKEECLDIVGRVLAKNYLNPSGPYYKGTTIDSVNKTYAADPAWDSKVAKKVTYFYKVISENRAEQLKKLK